MNQVKNLLPFILLSILFATCNKDAPYMHTGQITGLDPRMCVCCGGTYISIDNMPNPSGGNFLIGSFPSNFSLGNNPKFPINVKLDFTIDTVHCFGRYISISRITKRKPKMA